MTMEKQPFEDVSPTKNGVASHCHVSFEKCKLWLTVFLCTSHWLSKFYYLNVLYGEGMIEQHMAPAATFSLMAFSPRFPWVVIDVPKWGPSEFRKKWDRLSREAQDGVFGLKKWWTFQTLKLFLGEDVCNQLHRWFETCFIFFLPWTVGTWFCFS